MTNVDELRRLLLDPAQAAALDVHGRTDAAVLVPLYEHDGDLHLVFTRRRDDLRRHPGEISFPGGRQDEPDEDLVATALREAEEEIGLPVDAVEILGALQPTPTIATNYAIYPFVGRIEPGHVWKPSAAEVASALDGDTLIAPTRVLTRHRARPWGRIALLAALLIAAVVAVAAASFSGGDSPRVEPVPHGTSAAQQARNLGAWLEKYSR